MIPTARIDLVTAQGYCEQRATDRNHRNAEQFGQSYEYE
jgi:hypothetical protein